MIDKETFRATEKKIYNYFKKDKVINSLKHKVEILNKQVDQIEKKLRSTDISIPEESKAMSYEERVQTSSTGESYAERTAVRIADKLIKEQSRKMEEIADIEEEIRNIEADNVIIGDNIGGLRRRDSEFLETKYNKELPEWRVGVELHMSQSQVNRKKQRLIENVARWDAWQQIKKK
ncbi:hypothetical protein [Clostridium hydrogenum]|uniref:hypothetical protein n=1 Tax=Clostridium hydrogenum TaxID=2855764 RepID=UPI001F235586|nr:hypothetical protein [Clostridium hydrogenum]